ncbi:MAG: serine/threonine-protein kinase [Myxococcota bacterium]
MSALYGDRLGEGAWVDGYVVGVHAGEGASSDVYRAEGPRGPVALKVLKRALVSDAVALQRFAEEQQCLSRFTHPNLVRLEASGDLVDGRPWLALEWLDGETCAEAVTHRGAQAVERVVTVLEAVGSALVVLHDGGFVHRDVAPHNVMLCADGRVVLLDFGVGRREGRSTQLTSTGHLLGTPLVLAPEVLGGAAASPASDVYSLGILGWTLLHGAPPFRAASLFELVQLHAHGALPAWGRRDAAWLEPLLRQCLARSPEVRLPLRELLAALARRGGSGQVVVAYLRVRGEAEALDAWEEEVRESARALGLTVLADGAATLWGLAVADGAPERVRAPVEAWLSDCVRRAPAEVRVEARVQVTSEADAGHPERWL